MGKQLSIVKYVIPMFLLFISCAEQEENVLEKELQSVDDFSAASSSFAKGEATTALQYFDGVLAQVTEVDIALGKIDQLDKQNAEEAKFKSVLDSTLNHISNAKRAMDLYANKDWPKRKELHDLTIEWFDIVEVMIVDHLNHLTGSLSRDDEGWSDEEFERYQAYLDVMMKYIEVDNRWIEFQSEYAEANGFSLTDNIDIHALIDESVEQQ